MASKFEETRNEYIKEKKGYHKLLETHKDVAGKLLNTLKTLVNEKQKREDVENEASALQEENRSLNTNKVMDLNTIRLLSQELEQEKQKTEELLVDKKAMHDIILNFQHIQDDFIKQRPNKVLLNLLFYLLSMRNYCLLPLILLQFAYRRIL